MPRQNAHAYSQAQSEAHKGFHQPGRRNFKADPHLALIAGLLILSDQVQGVKAAATHYDVTAQVINSRSPSAFDLPYYGTLGLQLTVTKNDDSTGTPVVTNQTVLNYQHTINTYTYQQRHTTTTGTGNNQHTTTYWTTENYASLLFMNALFNCLNANAVASAYLPIAALLFGTAQEIVSTAAFNQPFTQGAQLYGTIGNVPLSAFSAVQNAELALFNGCINVAAAEQRKVAAIVGGVIGGVVALCCIAALVVYCCKNRSRAASFNGISFIRNSSAGRNTYAEPTTDLPPVLVVTSEQAVQPKNPESMFGSRRSSPIQRPDTTTFTNAQEERSAFEPV